MDRPARRPDIDHSRLLRFVAEAFGLAGVWSPLPGERDRNARLDTEDRGSFVVKVSSPDEPNDVLAFEVEAMAWLADRGVVPVPPVVPTRDGHFIARGDVGGSRSDRVRVLGLLPGRTLAATRRRGSALLVELGRTVGAMTRELAEVPGEAPERPDFDWSLDRAGAVMTRVLEDLPDARRSLIAGILAAFEGTAGTRADLPRQTIHGDVNDHNVLTSVDASDEPHVTGVLDFGDLHSAPAVYELAVAIAYALLDQTDPMVVAADVVAGFHVSRPLSAKELSVVMPLVRARLGASVCMAVWRRRDNPDPDPYLLVSEEPAWAALAALDQVSAAVATGWVRRACGLEPCERSADVRAWIAGRAVGPMVEPGRGVTVLDLSVASPLLNGRDTDNTDDFTRRTFEAIEREGASVGVGRYDEPRGFYLTDAFAGRSSEMPERRTVHIGLDLFAPPGTPIHAPLDGRVVSVRDNADRLDYGPTVILEHETPVGPIWTLYGHLERSALREIVIGDRIPAGGDFARVGPFPENGDWPPHLHLQLLLDRMEYEGTFPGVAAPRERTVWTSFCPDPSVLTGLGVDARWREPDTTDLRVRRARHLGPSLSLSYANPIHVVRGRGAGLFDTYGREYLDCVNNVAHVGHEHPRVVDALTRQARVLNTNTRYLHESTVAYAERLTALFPDALSVCYLVNSGSEANELALRLARAHTGRRGVVVLEGGYHGHTQALIDVSHYKYSRAGGLGAPPWVRAAPMPDVFRGMYRGGGPDLGARYASHVREAAEELSEGVHGLSAFLSEAILSCGGQVDPPVGFLSAAYRAVRALGGVCISDEVQIGFGRLGSHLWGFETQGVVPDIVTLGKPIGNGHPMGAVITTPEIAASFDNGMEFFSTFGGNPVSGEVGMAVLDVLEAEGLQEHALRVGGTVTDELRALADRYPTIGDVRGRGLFLGVEMVHPSEIRSDAAAASYMVGHMKEMVHPSEIRSDAAAASYMVGRMKERGILLSTDGPYGNVIKFKPPMVFDATDGERLVREMGEVLGEWEERL